MTPEQSEPYKGPLTVFTVEELRQIQAWARRTNSELHVVKSIRKKIDRAFAADPKFREPM